jgi:Spy/CpxP family protein refolding chaperone
MKHSKFVFSGLLLSGILAISLPIAANAESQFEENADHDANHFSPNQWHSGHHFGHDKESFHFPPEVNLTESQRDQIFSIKHKQEALFYEQDKSVRKAKIDLHKLLASDQYDDDKAKAITEKLGKALGNIKFLRVQEMHQIYALLTPEQRNVIKTHRFNRPSESNHPEKSVQP